jgi:ribosomal 50S subunit-recycling heat shock protein
MIVEYQRKNTYMRIDKYLKLTHIIKRREVAKEMLDMGLVFINGKAAKPANEIKVGDLIKITNPNGKSMIISVKDIKPAPTIEESRDLYDIIESK